MMGEVAKLIDNADGKLIEAAYERTAKALLDQKIISKDRRKAPTPPRSPTRRSRHHHHDGHVLCVVAGDL
jgi:hypothetical protein